MRKTTLALVIAISAGIVAIPAAGPQATSGDRYRLIPIPESAVHHRATRDPRIREAGADVYGTSTNWSGYAVLSEVSKSKRGEVTDVQGTWTVPEPQQSTSANTYSSIWVGIDGYSDNTVEQIGTEQDWSGDHATYYAWFEMYPKRAYLISGFPVAAGDSITASVSTDVKGVYVLTLTNTTQDETFSITLRAGGAKNTSAEWIVEAPYWGGVLPLADFGTVHFTDCSATIGGTTGDIDSFAYDAITMASGGTTKATPSGLSGGGSRFDVTWSHE